MNKLTVEDLYKLEDYAANRDAFRAKVMAHKKPRRVAIGPHLTLYFEDRLTMQYQIQEMLRVERIFEREAIEEELDAYNPLIPDGSNLKATCMIEYADVEERKKALARLRGVEDTIWVRVGDFDKVYAIANEDLERTNDEKTSAVHFMRFELSDDMVAAANTGASIRVGADHAEYTEETELSAESRTALGADLAA